jgi:hypothetical protein
VDAGVNVSWSRTPVLGHDVRKTVSDINQHVDCGTRNDVGQLGCMVRTYIQIKGVDFFVALSESMQFRDAWSIRLQTDNEAGLTSAGRRNKSRTTECQSRQDRTESCKTIHHAR